MIENDIISFEFNTMKREIINCFYITRKKTVSVRATRNIQLAVFRETSSKNREKRKEVE